MEVKEKKKKNKQTENSNSIRFELVFNRNSIKKIVNYEKWKLKKKQQKIQIQLDLNWYSIKIQWKK